MRRTPSATLKVFSAVQPEKTPLFSSQSPLIVTVTRFSHPAKAEVPTLSTEEGNETEFMPVSLNAEAEIVVRLCGSLRGPVIEVQPLKASSRTDLRVSGKSGMLRDVQPLKALGRMHSS